MPDSDDERDRLAWVRSVIPVVSILVLSLIYVGIRLIDLDRLVTTDEPFWLGRSANFYRALRTGDLAHTYQMAHPGILTMWAGAIAFALQAPDYARLIPINLPNVHAIGIFLRDIDHDPLDLLVAAKASKGVMQGLFFTVCLVYLSRLFGLAVMAVAGAMIAFDPFLSGLDSSFHVDGLFAITSFAAVLGLAYAMQADTALPWVVAGMLATCAWYTRITGSVLIVLLLAALLVATWRRWRRPGGPGGRAAVRWGVRSGLIWGAAAGITSLLLLPALWVDPATVLGDTWDWAMSAASDGHEHPLFFRGEVHRGDPGALFYPISLLWRLTPITLAGLVLFIWLAWRGHRSNALFRSMLASLALPSAFALLYLAGMTAGAKKFDRYILPVYPVLDLLAAIGFVLLATEIARRGSNFARVSAVTIVALAIVGQMASTASVLPYRLDYYNPLLGGTAEAEHEMQMGWGQGADQALAFIAEAAGDRERVVVQTSSSLPVFRYLAPDGVAVEKFGLNTPADWYETDFFVPGIQQWLRGLSPSYHMFAAYDPAYLVTVEGVVFFEVYEPRRLPLPPELMRETGCTVDFGPDLRLLQVANRGDTLDFYWLTVGEAPPETVQATVILSPRNPGDRGLTFRQSVTWAPAGVGLVSKVSISNPVNPAVTSGLGLEQYRLTITVEDIVAGEPLLATSPGSPIPEPSATVLPGCYRLAPGTPAS